MAADERRCPMRKLRLWLCLLAVVVLVAAALVAFFEPTRTVWGLLAGEPFFRERSLSYWREVLREHGRNGNIPPSTANPFWDTHAAFPVLRACARDPDRNVRWPAVALFGRGGLRTTQVLDLLVNALEDEDVEVRLKAIGVLAGWGRMARGAVPALVARFQDPELQVAHVADLVLWHIDPEGAPAACGWRPFTSEEFGVSAMLPGEPEREDKTVLEGVVAHTFQCWHGAGPYQAPTRYVVLVVEYQEGVLEGKTEEERFQAMRDSAPFLLPGGKILEEKKVSLGELGGRDYLVEVEGLGRFQNRVFWAGRKLYGVAAAYKPEFLNAPAAAYFLDSFRVEERPAKGCER